MKTKRFIMMMAAGMLMVAMASCNKEEDSWQETSPFDANGASRALFSVSDSRQVHFSRGNLQYQASTGGWRFALEQYDCCGTDNESIGEDYDGWIDLLAWGTSGWEGASVAPWVVSEEYSDYWPGGASGNSLTGDCAEADWGVHNAIVNGGNQPGMWRTLTADEWTYLLGDNAVRNGKWASAMIDGLRGIVVLPDNWELPDGLVYIAGQARGWETNVYTLEEWSRMEQAGALFLPAAGMRRGLVCGRFANWPNATGLYWSSTAADVSAAFGFNFIGSDCINPGHGVRSWGCSVRLVKDAVK